MRCCSRVREMEKGIVKTTDETGFIHFRFYFSHFFFPSHIHCSLYELCWGPAIARTWTILEFTPKKGNREMKRAAQHKFIEKMHLFLKLQDDCVRFVTTDIQSGLLRSSRVYSSRFVMQFRWNAYCWRWISYRSPFSFLCWMQILFKNTKG